MNETYTGVVDRIVDGKTAVILLENDGEVIEQLDVAVEQLPNDSASEGSVLVVTVDDGQFVDAGYQPNETKQQRDSAQARLDRLSKRLDEE